MSGQGDSYRPNFGSGRPPPPLPDSVRDAMFSFDGVRRSDNAGRRYERDDRLHNRRGRPRRDQDRDRRGYGRSQYQRYPRGAHSRPLLMQSSHREEEVLRSTSAADKFRNVDEITDSEENDMSESAEDSDGNRPMKKAKTLATRVTAADALPKWSNPDPYTALPPVAEGTGKRTDVLKLIRKAKIDDASKPRDEMKDSEDFISFGDMNDDDDDDDDDDDYERYEPPTRAPKGPRSDRLQDAPSQFDSPGNDHLGKRKRGQKHAALRPPDHLLPDRLVLPKWAARSTVDASPWFDQPRSQDPAGVALHKEVIDFYQWVKPQDFEREVRADVVHRLGLAFNRIEPGELKAFGSYAAGLYLPIGDMDLVYNTRGFRPGLYQQNGLPPKPPRNLLEKFFSYIKRQGLAKPHSVLLIGQAKVPIIKFVEASSGLQVDLSFNNDTGLQAVDTFRAWKALHPTMPILVSVIKQFLMIRGLNDVSTGGLGGFSIICLVTSLLQHMPGSGVNSNIGQLLVEFFNLYGYLLDRDNVAIRMDPPGYIEKSSYKPMLFQKDKPGRLTIIDPNRPENNISGGSHLVAKIMDAFAHAHDLLLDRLSAYERGDSSVSFLKDLVGGDFGSYRTQRTQLAELYFGLTGQDPPGYVPAQRSNATSKTLAAGNEGDTDDSASSIIEVSVPNSLSKKMKSGQRRAMRLKEARPDLARKIGLTISVAQAVKIGGYANSEAFVNDMNTFKQGRAKLN